MKRDLVAEHRELRKALDRLEGAAASICLPSNDELAKARARAFRVLQRVDPIPIDAARVRVVLGRPPSRPAPRPGDRVGARTVVAILPPTGGRADRRVEWRCDCGATGTSLIFNFRRMSPQCLHGDVREAREPSRTSGNSGKEKSDG